MMADIPVGATVRVALHGRYQKGIVYGHGTARPFPWLKRVPVLFVRLWDGKQMLYTYVDGDPTPTPTPTQFPDGRTVTVRADRVTVVELPKPHEPGYREITKI